MHLTCNLRIVEDCNSLTHNIVNEESMDIFKGKLDKQRRTEWFKILKYISL